MLSFPENSVRRFFTSVDPEVPSSAMTRIRVYSASPPFSASKACAEENETVPLPSWASSSPNDVMPTTSNDSFPVVVAMST